MTESGVRGPGSDKAPGHRMWGGRFTEPPDPRILEFTSSFAVDRRLFRWDLIGSIAHAQMLGETAIIPPEDADTIVGGLRTLAADVDARRLTLEGPYEDIHSFIESQLYERIGPAAGRLHTARSRNDQVITAFRLYVKDAAAALGEAITELMEETLARAAATVDDLLPGFTHLQHAQPIRLAHHLLAYCWMFARDVERLRDCYRRADVLPLGSGAVAGVSFPVDRHQVAVLLGFAVISENSLDATSDRDFAVDLVSAAALVMSHLSRWSAEVGLWASDEFGFITLADSVAHGSSIMPQKKNPDAAELIRGRAGRIAAAVPALLGILKGLPLGYSSDLQEDKAITFDAVDTALSSVRAMTVLLRGVQFAPERMRAAARRGLTTATEVADYLVRKGVPFRDAHDVAGRVVQLALSRGCELDELSLESFREVTPLFEADILAVVGVDAAVEAKQAPGGTAKASVLAQLEEARHRLAALRAWCRSAGDAARRLSSLLEG
jgi:argininosuccinate lyase